MVACPWGLMNMGIDIHAYGGYTRTYMDIWWHGYMGFGFIQDINLYVQVQRAGTPWVKSSCILVIQSIGSYDIRVTKTILRWGLDLLQNIHIQSGDSTKYVQTKSPSKSFGFPPKKTPTKILQCVCIKLHTTLLTCTTIGFRQVFLCTLTYILVGVGLTLEGFEKEMWYWNIPPFVEATVRKFKREVHYMWKIKLSETWFVCICKGTHSL